MAEAAPDLVDIDEARRIVLERCKPLGTEILALGHSLGRVLAEPIVGTEPVPAFDNSAMDGYAVLAADTAGAGTSSPATLRLAGESRAGRPATGALEQGQAIAISTGAVIPDGADAVVRSEDTERRDDEVRVSAEATVGLNIRRAGEDIKAGERVLEPGGLIGPAELGVIATAPMSEVSCARRPTVRLLVTGDELIGPDEPLRPGAVRESNAFTVPALAAQAGAEVLGVEHAGDDPAATRDAVARALQADVTVICGGVSVGEHDHVRPALSALGVEQLFWGVALRPGKPTFFGTGDDGGLVFALPGNPVSAMVTFLLFARPALLALQGRDPSATRLQAILAADYGKSPGRAHAIRCFVEASDRGWTARPTKEQGSHVLTSMLGADGLAIIPSASGDVRAGEQVTVELMPGRPGMILSVKLFAILRERAGADRIELELADGATVGDVLHKLADDAALGELIERLPIRIAVNREYGDATTELSAGDEVALIPPVSGGSPEDEGRVYVRVHGEPLDPGAISARVGRPGAGAIVTFQGTTRDVERLEYEAYAEMAEQKMRSILEDCVKRHGLQAAAAEHRIGSVALGESSVVVAVSAAHRQEAFAGAREAIDRMKAEAPIWKQEVDGDQAHWVQGTPPPR